MKQRIQMRLACSDSELSEQATAPSRGLPIVKRECRSSEPGRANLSPNGFHPQRVLSVAERRVEFSPAFQGRERIAGLGLTPQALCCHPLRGLVVTQSRSHFFAST